MCRMEFKAPARHGECSRILPLADRRRSSAELLALDVDFLNAFIDGIANDMMAETIPPERGDLMVEGLITATLTGIRLAPN